MTTETSIDIRPAKPDDWETIVEFNCRLAEESEGKILDRALIIPGVQTILANPAHGSYFVACHGARIIGQLMHTREWSDWRNGEIWWLQSVYVHKEFRRQGVFRSLFRHLEQLASRNPTVIGLRLYAEHANSKALDAYQQLGFQQTGYIVLERFFRNSL